MIPRVIHQIWWQGTDSVPQDYLEMATCLRRLNPEWRYELWDDSSLKQACAQVGPWALSCYERFPYLHQKVDFGRYVVLYLWGGLSVDMDVRARKPLKRVPGIKTATFLISESAGKPVETLLLSLGCMSRMYNNAMIGCEPRHPVALRLLKDVHRASENTSALTACSKFYTIQWTTGPFRLTYSIQDSIKACRGRGRGGVTVLPNRYFEGCLSHDVNCSQHPDAVLEHQHRSSWIPAPVVRVTKAYYWVKPYLLLCVIAVMLAHCRRRD